MKRAIQVLLLGFCSIGTVVGTAYAGSINDEIELMRTDIQADRKVIIANTMQFSRQESEIFWPLYNDYQLARNKVSDRKVKVIRDYAEHYDDLSDAQAKAMLAEVLDIEKANIKLKQAYVKKFERILPSKKVARYFQAENKLDALINVQLAAEIPLIR